MSGNQHVLTGIGAAVCGAITVASIAGCSSSTTTSPGNGSGTTTTPIESSTAVAKAKEQATACISKTGLTGLASSSGRSELVNCITSIVPPAEREAFKECVTSATLNDRVWTSEGRTKFTDTSVPNCVNQVSVGPPSSSP